jgi:hypothetical protein
MDTTKQSATPAITIRLLATTLALGALTASATWSGDVLAQEQRSLSQDRPGAPPTDRGGPTPSPAGAAVYFVGLRDGATISRTSVVHFGLRNMGVAPAGSDRENSGHHHLLIDTDLPPLHLPIPNDPNHLHFGAGQTEAEVTLSPGQHTLQLLLGDKDHIPHNPPVMSERIRVTVVDAAAPQVTSRPTGRKPSPPDARVYFENVRDGSVIARSSVIRFGLVNMGIAPAGVEKPGTGHHHLIIDAPLPALDRPIPNDPNHLHFGSGQTEAKVTLPLGAHTLQLLLGDENHVPHDPPVMSQPIKVTVTATGEAPRAERPRKKRRPPRRQEPSVYQPPAQFRLWRF